MTKVLTDREQESPNCPSKERSLLSIARSYVYGGGATFADLEEAVRSETEVRPRHWHCDIHGDFDAMVAVGCPECTRVMRTALRGIATNALKSSTNTHPQYVAGVSHGLGIAADMARRVLPAEKADEGPYDRTVEQ
jgi:hypothetical protein